MRRDTTKAKLITIVCAMELESRLSVGLRDLGCVSGYTIVHATGHGIHGHRTVGFVDGGNIRVEIVVAPAHETPIVSFLIGAFEGDALMAFVQDVDALPANQFL